MSRIKSVWLVHFIADIVMVGFALRALKVKVSLFRFFVGGWSVCSDSSSIYILVFASDVISALCFLTLMILLVAMF